MSVDSSPARQAASILGAIAASAVATAAPALAPRADAPALLLASSPSRALEVAVRSGLRPLAFAPSGVLVAAPKDPALFRAVAARGAVVLNARNVPAPCGGAGASP